MKICKKWFYITILTTTILLSGCSQEEIYYSAQNYSIKSQQMLQELADGNAEEYLQGTAQNIGEKAEDIAYKTSLLAAKKVRGCAPLIIIPSIVIGAVLLWISRYTTFTKIRKIAIFFFILGVPLITLACAYGLSFLANWLH